jgi:hypothetical protein
MISKKVLDEQIKRLMRLPLAPSADEDVKGLREEFLRIFRAGCKSDAHVAAVVELLVDSKLPDGRGSLISRIPAPADLVEAIRSVNAPELIKAPLGCGVCHGSGLKSYVSNGYDTADFCDCELGVWKRESERSRKEDAAARKAAKGHQAPLARVGANGERL